MKSESTWEIALTAAISSSVYGSQPQSVTPSANGATLVLATGVLNKINTHVKNCI